MLWIPITLIASTGQILRNGVQASLTARVGTMGATQVRFVFGLPFALLFFLAAAAWSGWSLPPITVRSLLWAGLGSVSQIAATALMLVVMHRRAFVVAYAYIKTEPVLVAIFGLLLLHESLGLWGWAAVLVVTGGVVVASVKPGEFGNLLRERGMIGAGLAAGGLFGLSAIAFRGAIRALPEGAFFMRALEILAISMTIQTLLLVLWLGWRERAALTGPLREWRRSILAGFLGALASAGWFCAFALTQAANVRTLALVEMPLAALLSRTLTGKRVAGHELAGLLIVAAGAFLLVAESAGWLG